MGNVRDGLLAAKCQVQYAQIGSNMSTVHLFSHLSGASQARYPHQFCNLSMFHKLPPLVEKPIPSSCNKFLSKSIEVFSSLCLADRRTDAVELGTVSWSGEAVERLAICSNAVCNVHAAWQIVPRFASYERAKETKKSEFGTHEAHIIQLCASQCRRGCSVG